jgi:Flp pilus assembly protein TadG
MNAKTSSERNKQYLHRGQSLVEFAIILPILLLLVLGAMDFARLFSAKIVLTNAAREGVNYLTINRDDFSGAHTAINTELQNITLSQAADISCPMDGAECLRGGKATVTLTTSVDLIIGGFLQTFGLTNGPIELSSTVEMMVR